MFSDTLTFTATWVKQKQHINSFWPSDDIWQQRSRSTLVQVMNGLLLDRTKLSPEPMLTSHQSIEFTLEQCHKKSSLTSLISPYSHIYVSMNWVTTDSGNSLSPVRRQAITWTNADVLSIEPLGINFSEIWIKIQNVSFMKMHLKM